MDGKDTPDYKVSSVLELLSRKGHQKNEIRTPGREVNLGWIGLKRMTDLQIGFRSQKSSSSYWGEQKVLK